MIVEWYFTAVKIRYPKSGAIKLKLGGGEIDEFTGYIHARTLRGPASGLLHVRTVTSTTTTCR